MYQIFFAALIQAAVPVGAPSVDPGRLPALVDSVAGRELRAGPTAGLSVAVMQGGTLLFARGYGYADLENPAAVNVETVFKIGSVTKQVTTVLLGQLVDQGKVDLDADVRTYMPDAPTGGRRVTIAQLLNHTSGIRSFTNLGVAVSRDSFRLDLTTDRLIDLLRNVPPDFEPGTSWQYNNTGYLIAGMLVEKLTGLSLAEVLARQITTPLGLTRTSWCDERAIVPNRARGYRRTTAGFERGVGESMSIPRGAGALCSTPIDLVRFRDALAKGRLLSRATYE
ncbi:MAG: serine hydrolase domain-containing protein, partial [Gemmatimonadales bacterium]